MAFKSIRFVATDAAIDGPALSAALGIAGREGAHLDIQCIGIEPSRFEALPIGTMSAVIEISVAEAQEHADMLQAWVKAKLPAGMTQVSVQPLTISSLGLDPVIGRLTRYADLIVVTQPYGPGRTTITIAITEAALFSTGAPVLIAPANAVDYDRPFNRVMVAWNEAEEGLSAIRKALPILQAARQVDIVLVDPPSHSPERSDPGGALSIMLSRHGVRAEVSILAQTLPRVSDVLLRFAREHDTDAIVMGAYGHSRFRQAILGGVTREMLEKATLPVIMAH